MRKVLWCCALLAVLAGTAVYLTADYANRHPDSFVGHCVLCTYRTGTAYNPVYHFVQATGRSLEAVRSTMSKTGSVPTTISQSPAESQQVTPLAAVPQTGDAETVRPVPTRLLGKIVIPMEEEEHPARPDSPQPPLAPPAGATEEAEPLMPPAAEDAQVGAWMPYASDEVQVPDHMPYASDTAEATAEQALSTVWQHLLEEVMHPAAGGEECEQSPIQDCHEHSCPHSRCCPYTGKCYDDEPAKTSIDRDEKNFDLMRDGPTPPAQPAPPGKQPGANEDSETCPMRSDVDTMEFRRSDARPYDFDTLPF